MMVENRGFHDGRNQYEHHITSHHLTSHHTYAQEERGCTEHILGLRLIIDYAKKEKVKLFVLFIDFMIRCHEELFETLKNLGCGKRFLSALISIYKNTINILNSEYVKATIGVKQGGVASCSSFI